MKAIRIHKALLVACIAFIALYGCATTGMYAPSSQVGSGSNYLGDISSVTAQRFDDSTTGADEGVGEEMLIPAALAYVFSPYLTAAAAVMVNSTIGMIGDALIPDDEGSAVIDLAGTE